jgi:hypothetical protein
MGTDFNWTIRSFSTATAAATAAAAAVIPIFWFSEFSLGRKGGVVRCKRDGKSRRVCTTPFWFEIGALHEITFFFTIYSY